MTPKTAPPKGKSGAKQRKPKQQKTTDRDGGLERLYARVSPKVKTTIDAAAAADGRSTMNYVERMINQRAEALDKKRGK